MESYKFQVDSKFHVTIMDLNESDAKRLRIILEEEIEKIDKKSPPYDYI